MLWGWNYWFQSDLNNTEMSPDKSHISSVSVGTELWSRLPFLECDTIPWSVCHLPTYMWEPLGTRFCFLSKWYFDCWQYHSQCHTGWWHFQAQCTDPYPQTDFHFLSLVSDTELLWKHNFDHLVILRLRSYNSREYWGVKNTSKLDLCNESCSSPLFIILF